MHLLYVDESGSASDTSQTYFILAGVSVFERQTHWIEQQLNGIAARFNPNCPHELELHGSPMRSGKQGWRSIQPHDREQAIKDALTDGVANQKRNAVRLFGAVINKKTQIATSDPVFTSFEQVASRFDMFLQRLHLNGNTHRGLMLCDASSSETRIQTLAREFKYSGHSFGKTKNYSEVPVFLDSKASRLIQLADLVAYAMFRHYERQDSQYFDIIKHCFDSDGGVQHGLYESL